jgi:hypothetical protein
MGFFKTIALATCLVSAFPAFAIEADLMCTIFESRADESGDAAELARNSVRITEGRGSRSRTVTASGGGFTCRGEFQLTHSQREVRQYDPPYENEMIGSSNVRRVRYEIVGGGERKSVTANGENQPGEAASIGDVNCLCAMLPVMN